MTIPSTQAPPAEVLQPDRSATVPAPLPTVGLERLPTRARPGRRPQTGLRVKRVIWIVVAIALAVTLALGLRPKAVGVETAAVSRGTLVVTVNEDGRTRVKDRYLISAPLAGTVTRMTLHAGDEVAQGMVVARLVPSAAPLLDSRSRAEAEARVAAAKATLSQAGTAVERARAAYRLAGREAARERSLLSQGATAPQMAEQTELIERIRREELASAEFGRRIAASELQIARAALASMAAATREEFAVHAPVRGQVLRVHQESEAVVQAGTPLLEIGNPLALEVVVDVLTTDAVDIRPGASVRIERWGGDSTLTGHVRQVEPSAFTQLSALGIEEQRVNVIIDLDSVSGSWAKLGDGYRVEASIVVWVGHDRVVVPGGAIFREGTGWATYVMQDGRARLRSVELGRSNGSEVEVVKGLQAAERVILYPTEKVGDGVRAEVR